jgi:hypothetical protein
VSKRRVSWFFHDGNGIGGNHEVLHMKDSLDRRVYMVYRWGNVRITSAVADDFGDLVEVPAPSGRAQVFCELWGQTW